MVAAGREHADAVGKVSIIPRGIGALGHTQQTPSEDRYLVTRAELLDRLDVLLGGRVAEELVFGDVSTGAQDDLRRATEIARAMIVRYGMSDVVGLATFVGGGPGTFLQRAHTDEPQYSDATAHAVDREIQRVLDDAYARVRSTLTTHRAALDTVAKLLVEQEVVTGDTVTRVLEEAAARMGSSRPDRCAA